MPTMGYGYHIQYFIYSPQQHYEVRNITSTIDNETVAQKGKWLDQSHLVRIWIQAVYWIGVTNQLYHIDKTTEELLNMRSTNKYYVPCSYASKTTKKKKKI